MYVIKVYATYGPTGEPLVFEPPRYIVSIDPDARGGLGDFELAADVIAARRFDTIEEAGAYWGAQSTVVPLRDDGQPNRPGTIFTVEVVHEVVAPYTSHPFA